MVKRCFVAFCKTGSRPSFSGEQKYSLFKAPNDESMLEKWQESIPLRDRDLNSNDRICEKHFEQRFVVPRFQQTRHGQDFYHDRIRAKLTPDAVPSIFPDTDPLGKPLKFKESKAVRSKFSVLLNKKIALMLPEVQVNESDYVPVCYKCLIKKCSSHIVICNEKVC